MKVFEHVPLSEIVFYHIGGEARFVIQIENQEDVSSALEFIKERQLSSIQILGLGSNIVLPDTPFSGVVLYMKGDGNDIHLSSPGKVTAFAGEHMDSVITYSLDKKLIGLEWAGGLPSTVGGAIRGNAGAFGTETKESIESITAVDLNDPHLELKTYSKEQADFSYRNSFFKLQPNLLIVSGTFALKEGSDEELERARQVYKANREYRQKNHPMEYPSCGSVFKNIVKREEVEKILAVWPDVRELSEGKWHNKVSMGYVINRLGFSGKQVGGAQVSTKHTNYIVNVNNATADDVKSLIYTIQGKFEETFGFTPEPEVMLVESYA